MAETVCLDTHALIWGVQGVSTLGQENMIPKTRSLLRQLGKDKATVIIPSIVFAEFLVGIPQDEHPQLIEFFQRRFIVQSYDIIAAGHFARLWQDKHANSEYDRVKSMNLGATRAALKAELLIIATALAVGANCIYGYDKPMENFCKDVIEFRNIDSVFLQGELEI